MGPWHYVMFYAEFVKKYEYVCIDVNRIIGDISGLPSLKILCCHHV